MGNIKKKNDRNVIYGGWFPRKYLCNHSSALCLRSLIFSHHPPTVPTFSISCFSALVCLWHHKAGTVGCRDSEPVRCVRGISTPWDTEKTERDRKRELLQLQRSVMCYEVHVLCLVHKVSPHVHNTRQNKVFFNISISSCISFHLLFSIPCPLAAALLLQWYVKGNSV